MSRVDFDIVVGSLNPALWYKFNEVSGPALNHGWVGNVADAAIVNGIYQQPGVLGLEDAVVFENTGYADVLYDASWATFSNFTWLFVFEYLGPTTNGSGVSRLMGRGTGQMIVRDETLNTFYFSVRQIIESGTGPDTVTGAGVMTALDYPANNIPYVYGFSYNDAVDRRPRMYKNGNAVRSTKNRQRASTNDTVNFLLGPTTVVGIQQANVDGTVFAKNGSGPNGSHIAIDEILLFDKELTFENHRAINNALGL